MMRIFNESGRGYWMEWCGTLRAEGENRESHPGHVVLDRIGGGTERSDHSVIGCDIYNERTAYRRQSRNAHSERMLIIHSCRAERDCAERSGRIRKGNVRHCGDT